MSPMDRALRSDDERWLMAASGDGADGGEPCRGLGTMQLPVRDGLLGVRIESSGATGFLVFRSLRASASMPATEVPPALVGGDDDSSDDDDDEDDDGDEGDEGDLGDDGPLDRWRMKMLVPREGGDTTTAGVWPADDEVVGSEDSEACSLPR